jgi:hypothetical protein
MEYSSNVALYYDNSITFLLSTCSVEMLDVSGVLVGAAFNLVLESIMIYREIVGIIYLL